MRTLIIAAGFCALSLFAETKLGKPLTMKEQVTVAKLMESPGAFVGKTVQVKGKVTEVCQMMGCWMNLTDPASGAAVRIKVKDGEIVFPKDSVGKMAIAEGTLTRTELTKDQLIAQLKHEAEENKKKFDPATVKSGKTSYQIQGAGAVILD
jgi:hypothetical protein